MRSVSLLVIAGLSGCTILNPAFLTVTDGDSGDGSTTDSASTTGQPATTSGDQPATTDRPTTGVGPGSDTDVTTDTTGHPGTTTDSITNSTGTSSITSGPGTCGDGVVDGGEECDGVPMVDTPCTPECTYNVCGDGFKLGGEECDAGPNNSDNGECTLACTKPVCGDGKVQAGESCDDGNAFTDDECQPDCSFSFCGDGYAQQSLGEQCDDGQFNGQKVGGCAEDCSQLVPFDPLRIRVATWSAAGNFANGDVISGLDEVCGDTFGDNNKALFAHGTRVASTQPNTGEGQANWVLHPHRAYFNAKNELIGITNKTGLLGVKFGMPGPIAHPISEAPATVWTGLGEGWTTSLDNCMNWKDATPNSFGTVGTPTKTDSGWYGGTKTACNQAHGVYCVEQ